MTLSRITLSKTHKCRRKYQNLTFYSFKVKCIKFSDEITWYFVISLNLITEEFSLHRKVSILMFTAQKLKFITLFHIMLFYIKQALFKTHQESNSQFWMTCIILCKNYTISCTSSEKCELENWIRKIRKSICDHILNFLSLFILSFRLCRFFLSFHDDFWCFSFLTMLQSCIKQELSFILRALCNM